MNERSKTEDTTSEHAILIPTGYMGSGSSAITDILSSFEGCKAPNGSYEYVFLHCPNGLFDLEDKLLCNNNALRSDEAFSSFLSTMKELYDSPFHWVGNYKRAISRRFMDYSEQFIDSLIQYKSDNYWYHQEKHGWAAFPKLALNKAFRALSSGKIQMTKPLRYSPMSIGFPTRESFYTAAKKYLGRIFNDMAEEGTWLILDQLMLPHNLYRFDSYFDANAECYVVDRDPRDVFLSNKYIWGPRDDTPIPYPTDVNKFCDYYASMRSAEQPCHSAHVHRIHFEDCVYNYHETLATVARTIGRETSDVGTSGGKHFDPGRSIENTQLFLLPEMHAEGEIIANRLSSFLYPFPYERKPSIDGTF